MRSEMALVQNCKYCGSVTTLGAYCCSACRFLTDTDWVDQATRQQLSPKYSVYSEATVRAEFDESPSVQTSRFRIALTGLQCSSCVHLLENLPAYLAPVHTARVNFARGELYIDVERQANLGQILQFLDEMGYVGRPLKPGSANVEDALKEDRDLLGRVGVAGAIAGNIMLFTIPIYSGLYGNLGTAFKWISFVLFLPIVFYCALPFYKNAWGALKLRHLSADAPLVLALWAGFLASSYNLCRGRGDLYFDSTAGFIFLILISRWFLKSSQRRWLQGPMSEPPWLSEVVEIRRADGSNEPRLAGDLKAKEQFILGLNQVLAVDAVLVSEKGLFDTSWMTGEPVPRVCLAGMRLPAGYRGLSPDLELRAETTAGESELARGFRKIEAAALVESRRLNLFDQASRYLLASVLLVGASLCILGPGLLGLSLEESFRRALSLLIVACPCALAFGGPLAYGMALRRAARHGILVRGVDVLDRVEECKTIVFDKTGTLTLGKLKLVGQSPAHLPFWMENLILSIEKPSNHPVADAFRTAWADRKFRDLEIQDIHEIPGEKIFGLFQGQLYRLQACLNEGDSLKVALWRNDQRLAVFSFEDEIRPETPALLAQLTQNFEVQILSGDRHARVRHLIEKLGIKGLVGRGDQRPSQKARRVQMLNPCLMIGDGLNDGEALAAAHVGAALSGSIEHGLRQGHVYFLKPGLEPVLELLEVARRARRIVRRNLSFALIYNLGAGSAALLGLINPLAAAFFMPLSSILILFISWWGAL